MAIQKTGRRSRPCEVGHHKECSKTNKDPHNIRVIKDQEEHDRIRLLDGLQCGKRTSYKGLDQLLLAAVDPSLCAAFALLQFLLMTAMNDQVAPCDGSAEKRPNLWGMRMPAILREVAGQR